jgi:hypothetical protein
MAYKAVAIALSLLAAASPASANRNPAGTSTAPAGTETTRYCLRVDPIIGSRIETIQCRTRADWAALEVDVDQEWAENGVRVIA